MFCPRTILPDIVGEIDSPRALVITGMRQVGKTTILRYLYDHVPSPNKAFFDFENPVHVKRFDQIDFDAVLPGLADFGINPKEKAHLFLDEIQNLPVISRVIKYLHDHYQTKFFVTGSSSFYMKHLFPESMAGRKIIYELFPLTFSEFLTFKNRQHVSSGLNFAQKAVRKTEVSHIEFQPLYEEYVEYGGLPAVVLAADPTQKKKLLGEALTSYFEKDVKTLAYLDDRAKLRDLIFLLSPRVGNRIEIHKLASELAVSREKIYAYLELLEATYFIRLLPRYSQSIDRSSAGRRKLYFTDTGLAAFLGGISLGQKFENSVFQSLRPKHDLCFYHKDKTEVDFIVDKKAALEAKVTASKKDVYALFRVANSLHLSDYYVLSKNWFANERVILASDL